MAVKDVLLDAIRLDGGTQPRGEINCAVVSEYSALIESGVHFPPVDVFFDGADYWLADGFHRYHAASDVQSAAIACTVHKGTVDDARWFSFAANQSHGLRRSNEDKRRAVVAALSHPRGAKLSDNQIAGHVGVSQPFVGKIRGELESTYNGYKSTDRTGRDGRTTNTVNIGGEG